MVHELNYLYKIQNYNFYNFKLVKSLKYDKNKRLSKIIRAKIAKISNIEYNFVIIVTKEGRYGIVYKILK